MNEAFSPITIVENNVTITLESLIVNKKYDCSKCFYQDLKEDVCPYIKNTAINPKPCSNLRVVEIVVHIVNASDQRFDPSHWIMIDSNGYKFDGNYLCNDLLPRRYETDSEVLPGTQSRQIYVFSELEDGIFPSSFILHIPNKKDLSFPIKPLNDNVISLLQPPKPTDPIIDKVKAYIHTNSYRLLIDMLDAKCPMLSEQSRELVIQNLADNYYISVNNDQDVWEIKKRLLEEYPFLISIAEIVDYQYAEKNIFLIHSSASDSFETILQRLNQNYEKAKIYIDDIHIDVYILVQTFSSIEEYKSIQTETNGKLVWHQAEQERILCGYYTLDKTIRYAIFTEAQIRIRGYRELDLSKAKFAKAGYRNDLGEAFRSSWEANVARFLRYKSIKYTYEKQPYTLERNAYLPDFELENNTIIEVKGIWDAESLRKVSEFHRLNPEIQILPIDGDIYYDINADFSHLPYWEKTSVSAKPDYIPVVGLSFVPDQSVFSNLHENTSVRLIREYDNKYDKNAILVTLDDGRALGHISADWAMILAPKIDAGIKYESKVTQIKTKVIIICIKRKNFDERVFYSIFK